MYVHKRSIDDLAGGGHTIQTLWLLYMWTHLNKWHRKSKSSFDLVTNVENRAATHSDHITWIFHLANNSPGMEIWTIKALL